jgi:mRNA-degrading endonuclease YafQ of YafQ-DinJ toxin-antitoxin module
MLEHELDRVIGVLIDTADLAEQNRDHLLTLLKRLKEHKYL